MRLPARYLPPSGLMDKNDIIKRIVTREFGRFVRYYQDAPELEEVTRKESEDAGRKKKRTPQGAERLYLLLYKHRQKDHVQPVHIIEMLNRNAGRVDVGRIDLMQSSFLNVQVNLPKRL